MCRIPELGFYGLLPDFSNGLSVPSIAPIFGKLDFSGIFSLNFVVVVFAFLFVDMFDTIGTLIGVSSKAKMLDEEGKLPNIKGALMADAMATTLGAVMELPLQPLLWKVRPVFPKEEEQV